MSRILLTGNHSLTAAFSQELSDLVEVDIHPSLDFTPNLVEHYSVLVSVQYGADFESDLHIQNWAVGHQLPYLRIYLDFDEWVIGPFIRPSRPGCISCVETKQMDASRNMEHLSLLRRAKARPSEAMAPAPLPMQTAAAFIHEELARFLNGSLPLTDCRLYVLSLDSMRGSLHRFEPYELCEHCSSLPDDCEETARPPLQPLRKERNDTFRLPNERLTIDNLRERTFNARLGLVTRVTRYENKILPVVISDRSHPLRNTPDPSIGRELSFARGELTSYLECLERQAGARPIGKRTVVRGTYVELSKQYGERVYDPMVFALHSAEQYASEGFPFTAYDPERPIHWVWSYSFRQDAPVLIPEQIAYFSQARQAPEPRFVAESSNGCALGGSVEEAMLHGLFELAERDSFLMMWHARLPVPLINLDSLDNETVWQICERIRSLGFEPYVFNTTTDIGIPTVAAFIVNKEHRAPKFFVAGGGHRDPRQAVLGCLLEAAAHAQSAERMLEANLSQVETVKGDPSSIRQLEDHYLFYYHPDNFNVVDFLFHRDLRAVHWEETFPGWREQPPTDDLTIDLLHLVRGIERAGYEVIAVDQTPASYGELGLHAAKVIVPGLLQIGFGANCSRALHLRRLLDGPVAMGYRESPLAAEELNCMPHPFP
ncbi:MAG: TOMM precursor leader peptide-binding protein [Tumebacillaceae bacterium]